VIEATPPSDALKAKLSPAALEAFMAIGRARYFAVGLVSVTGETPEAIPAWQALVKDPAATEAFAELATSKEGAAQAYGLCGLYETDRAAFDAALKAALQRNPKVRVMSGCVGGKHPLSELAGGTGKEHNPLGGSIHDGSFTAMLLQFKEPDRGRPRAAP
jgi:hypothetical protein